MKNNARFQIDDRWWEKESPKSLGKAGKKFSDALKDLCNDDDNLNFVAGDDMLDDSDLKKLAECKTRLLALKQLGKKAAEECEDMAAKEKDKSRREDLLNTAEVLVKPLEKAIQDKAKEYDAMDGDTSNPLVSPDAHAAYLKKMLPKTKRMPLNFGFALISTGDHDKNRMLLHMQRKGRSLAQNVRNDTKPRKITWGVASGGSASGDEAVSGMTLVLDVEGPKIPNLGRRIRMMMQALGVSLFTKVIVREGGQEVEASDEAEPDMALEDVPEGDLDAELGTPDAAEPSKEAPKAAPPPPPPPPPVAEKKPATAAAPPPPPPPPGSPAPAAKTGIVDPEAEAKRKKLKADNAKWLEIRSALAKKVEGAVHRQPPHPEWKKINKAWAMATLEASKLNYAVAIKVGEKLTKTLASFEPPEETKQDEFFRKKEMMKGVVARLAKEGKGDASLFRACMGEAVLRQKDANWEGALKMLDQLAKYVEEANQPRVNTEPVPASLEGLEQQFGYVVEKLESMEEDLEAAVEALPDKKNEVDRNKRVVAQIDPGGVAAIPDPKKALGACYVALRMLQRVLDEAKKEGKHQSKVGQQLAPYARELEKRYAECVKYQDVPDLARHFWPVSQRRETMRALMEANDVYGAIASARLLESWLGALEDAIGDYLAGGGGLAPDSTDANAGTEAAAEPAPQES